MLQLAERHRELTRQNERLRAQLSEGELRIRSLEAQVLESNQRRKDVLKRVDDLIAQIDVLDTQLSAGRG